MTTKKPKPTPLTDEEKKQAASVIKGRFFEKMGLDPKLSEVEIHFGSKSDISVQDQQKLAMAKGLQIAMDQSCSEIRTQEDLHNALQALDGLGDRGPTLVREVMDQMRAHLRRRGGPGRDPLLNDREATILCGEILKCIGEGDSESAAISKISKRCPEIVDKKVGVRTVKTKAWDRRRKLLKIDQEKLK